MLKFCPLFSSSSGNSVYIGDNSGGILVDVGRSAKQTDLMLKNMGIDVDTIKGIFVTHEHTDHILGVVWMVRMIAASSSTMTKQPFSSL